MLEAEPLMESDPEDSIGFGIRRSDHVAILIRNGTPASSAAGEIDD